MSLNAIMGCNQGFMHFNVKRTDIKKIYVANWLWFQIINYIYQIYSV